MGPLFGSTRAARYTALDQWGGTRRYDPLRLVTVLLVALLLVRNAGGVTTGPWTGLHVTRTRRAR